MKFFDCCMIAALSLATPAYAGGGIKNVHSSVQNGQVLSQEPGLGTVGTGQIVYVDDGSCPAGQMKKIIGGKNGAGRQKSCVAH